MDITSGEMYYRIKSATGGLASELPHFSNFLRSDIDGSYQKSEMYNQHRNLKHARMHMRKNMASKLHIAKLVKYMINTKRDRTLASVEDQSLEITHRMTTLQHEYNDALMRVVLQYSALLVSELEMSRVNLRAEDLIVQSLQRQAKVAYELRLFAEYVRIETREMVTIETLSKDNEQYKRCKKAIKDNITPAFLRAGKYQGVRVLNIYHLQNDRLSKYLKAAVKSSDGGKVRGLFCALPKQSVYSMSVYGLHPRETFSAVSDSRVVSADEALTASTEQQQQPTSQLHQYYQLHQEPQPKQSTSPGKGRPTRDRATSLSHVPLGRNMFEWSWFCYPPLDSRKRQPQALEQSLPTVKGMGYAMKLSTQGSPSLASTSTSYLKFTRSSTPSDIAGARLSLPTGPAMASDNSASEEGCHIALCRVLMSKVLTVSGKAVDTSHFIEAARQGYDAIYEEASEEYILLQPCNVLPEFIMHIQLVRSTGTNAEENARRLQKSLLHDSSAVVGPTQLLNGSLPPVGDWVSYVDRFLTGKMLPPERSGSISDSGDADLDSKQYAQRKLELVRSVQRTTSNTCAQMKDSILHSSSNLKNL